MNPAWTSFCAETLATTFTLTRNFFEQLPSPFTDVCRNHLDRRQHSISEQILYEINCLVTPDHHFLLLSFAPLMDNQNNGAHSPGWSLVISNTCEKEPSRPPGFHTGNENETLPSVYPNVPTALLAKEIADRKLAEQNLEESRDRLTQIIHGNSIATFVIDQHHKITHWNKALERLTGISSKNIIGTSEHWKAFYSQKRPTMADLILDQVTEEKIHEFYAGKYNRSQLVDDSYEVEDFFELNGKETWLFFTAAPIKSRTGALIGAVETLQDITRRKTMEQEILQYQTVLENKVEERTYQLKKTYEQLLHAEKLSAVGKLAASIAHEFGNPIIGIRNFLQGIQKTTSFSQDDAELLELAIQECQRVKDLISNLQNFNRPTSGTMAPMDLHQALNDLLLFCKKSFRERHIMIRKKFSPNLPLIHAVHDQVKQVILNCLNNAQEAIPEHGGSILLTTEYTAKAVMLHIRDTGKGIDESDLVSIFEPFFSTKPAVEGTGLGLSVSYGIMKRHQGKIEVTDTSSQGTTFTISFPIPSSTH
ncbi:MAG: PAS domain S-box protein [Proteobacteria bacterium]|nr:PAS domain S-box protein [Pseudomonadota bacterium]